MYNIFTQKSIWLFSLKYQHKRYNNCPSCVLNTETPTSFHTPGLRSLWLWESLRNLYWSSRGLAELGLRIWWQRLVPRNPWLAAQETGPDPGGGCLGQKPGILGQHLWDCLVWDHHHCATITPCLTGSKRVNIYKVHLDTCYMFHFTVCEWLHWYMVKYNTPA